MTRAAPRSPFHSSRLVRLLAELGLADASQPGPAFAEKLGHWIGIKEAIGLRASHAPLAATAGAPTATVGTAAVAATRAFEAARAAMAQRLRDAGSGIESGSTYAPYRRHYQAQQRAMELALRPLRLQVRAMLAAATPGLRQLAALDAAMEGILGEREGLLLAALPARLEQRFKALHAAEPGGAARFGQELQSLLLAEWELRLQPTLGLLEALHNDTPHRPVGTASPADPLTP